MPTKNAMELNEMELNQVSGGRTKKMLDEKAQKKTEKKTEKKMPLEEIPRIRILPMCQ